MKKESIKDGKLQEAIKLADGFVDLINKSSHSGSYEIVGTAFNIVLKVIKNRFTIHI